MIEPLDDELGEFVGAFKQVERPTPTARAATWAAIDARIAAEDASTRRLGWPVIIAVAAAVALCLGLAAVVGWRARTATDVAASDHADDRSPRPVEPAPNLTPQTPRDVAPDPAPILAPPDAPEPGPPDAPEPGRDRESPVEPKPALASPESPAPEPPRSSRTSSPERRPRPASAPSLRPEEVASFRRAQTALADERAEAALRALDEHGRRFPGGMFEEERLVSRAAALCMLGRVAEARAARDRFLRDRPASHLVERARTICREIE